MGRASGPPGGNLLWEPGSVSVPSPPVAKCFALTAKRSISDVSGGRRTCIQCISVANRILSVANEGNLSGVQVLPEFGLTHLFLSRCSWRGVANGVSESSERGAVEIVVEAVAQLTLSSPPQGPDPEGGPPAMGGRPGSPPARGRPRADRERRRWWAVLCWAVGVAVLGECRCYILHLRESTPRNGKNGGESGSAGDSL